MWMSIHIHGNVDKFEGVPVDAHLKRIAWLDRHDREILRQRKELCRQFNFVEFVGRKLVADSFHERFILRGGLSNVTSAEIIFAKRFAEQLDWNDPAALINRIGHGFQQLERFLNVIVAVGENAAIELCLLRRQSVQLAFNSCVLVLSKKVRETCVGVVAGRDAGSHLCSRAGLLR